MKISLEMTMDEHSWLQEAVDQMLDDIPHYYDSEESERMLRLGRAIQARLKKVEQEQVYTH